LESFGLWEEGMPPSDPYIPTKSFLD